MLKKYLELLFLFFVFAISSAAQIPQDPGVTSPQNGDFIQGKVKITGNTYINGFQSAEVAYTYDQQNSNSWFLLKQLSKPVKNNGILRPRIAHATRT